MKEDIKNKPQAKLTVSTKLDSSVGRARTVIPEVDGSHPALVNLSLFKPKSLNYQLQLSKYFCNLNSIKGGGYTFGNHSKQILT